MKTSKISQNALYSNEQVLISDFNAGKHAALRELYERYFKTIYYYTQRLVADREQAEDIVTEAFLKLWDKCSDFDSLSRIKSFLYTTSGNASKNYLKHLKVVQTTHRQLAGTNEEDDVNMLHIMIEAEFLKMVFDEIDILPDTIRRIIKLLYFEGLKTDEIAREMQLSVQTVRNYKIKGLQLLKDGLLKKKITPATALLATSILPGIELCNYYI